MATKKARPSPAQWAASQPRRTPGPACWHCVTRDARAVIAEFVALPPGSTSHKAIHAYLVKFFKCPASVWSLGNHIRNHMGRP